MNVGKRCSRSSDEMGGGPLAVKRSRDGRGRAGGKVPLFAASTIERWVRQEAGHYVSAKIQKYVPVLVQRSVDATLHELNRPSGTSSDVLTLDPTTRLAPRPSSVAGAGPDLD